MLKKPKTESISRCFEKPIPKTNTDFKNNTDPRLTQNILERDGTYAAATARCKTATSGTLDPSGFQGWKHGKAS